MAGDEIANILRDYRQVKNLLNGDTVNIPFDGSTPVAQRLFEFLRNLALEEALDHFNRQDRERLR